MSAQRGMPKTTAEKGCHEGYKKQQFQEITTYLKIKTTENYDYHHNKRKDCLRQ